MAPKMAFVIFPNQLFKDTTALAGVDEVYLVEETLLFKEFKFNKKKLILHRASMRYYADYLRQNRISVNYIETTSRDSDIRNLLASLKKNSIHQISHYDVCDNWLEKRILVSCEKLSINRTEIPTPLFLNTKKDLDTYFLNRDRFSQADFYIQQRKTRNILIDEEAKPIGGKWSFDKENRLKYPKKKSAPNLWTPKKNQYHLEAESYVDKHFSDNYGSIKDSNLFPVTHEDSEKWLKCFLVERFSEFGAYEDAIVAGETFLNHSVLTPMLNIGLLTPQKVVSDVLNFVCENNVPLNSLEGFIRQVVGWREFIRGVYVFAGSKVRSSNYWGFKALLPNSLYDATTGIAPLDDSIRKSLESGYCHHIERLMVLGNYMLLIECDPNQVYRWFMEMFVDAYDWVMVPNVYSMSQFADGGVLATKPYISGSNYILKMSNYKKADWCLEWDALFWNFMNTHRDRLGKNPRLAMLLKTFDRFDDNKKRGMHDIAKSIIEKR